MKLILPYLNPAKFANSLISNYGFSNQETCNANLLVMPQETGSGTLQLFIRNQIHFFRGKWKFKEETIFYSNDPVGQKGFLDFRIGANGNIQSCAIEGRKRFEFETTEVDGMRIFIPEKFLPATRSRIHSQFAKYCFDINITKLLDSIFMIGPEQTENTLLLESKILEFIHYWTEFLCNEEIEKYFEGLSDYQKNCVKTTLEIINNDISLTHTIKDLSRKVGTNDCDLKKSFRTVTGLPIRKYLITKRLEKARKMVKNTDLPLYEICQDIGYSNRHHFAVLYKKFFGLHPSEHRK